MGKAVREFPFGFLLSPWKLTFEGGAVEPRNDYARWATKVEAELHRDGFYYPRVIQEVSWNLGQPIEEAVPIPKTKRPQTLFKLPPSHSLLVTAPGKIDLRDADAGFILHALAFLLGTRLQFEDRWFDGRVSVKLHGQHHVHMSRQTVEDFLSRAYRTWRGCRLREQRLFMTLLFLHTRSPGYAWDWERFREEYTVLDALWRVAVGCSKSAILEGKKEPSHGKRISYLSRHLRVRHPSGRVRYLVRLRNKLIHEGLWARVGLRAQEVVPLLGRGRPISVA